MCFSAVNRNVLGINSGISGPAFQNYDGGNGNRCYTYLSNHNTCFLTIHRKLRKVSKILLLKQEKRVKKISLVVANVRYFYCQFVKCMSANGPLLLIGLQVEKVVPDVPILRNDRPYTIEVYDASTPQKIEVLRINIDKNGERGILKTGIEMGRYKSNKVSPAVLDENSILKADQSSVSKLKRVTI